MAERIRVMISSRNNSRIELDGAGAPLSELRRRMKAKLEGIKPFGEPLFDVWINEDETADATETTWDHSLQQVREADILFILYNGDPGWPGSDGPGSVGICHAELREAVDSQRGKVFAIALPVVDLPRNQRDRKRHENFRNYWGTQKLWEKVANDGDEVLTLLDTVAHHAVWRLVTLGGRETRRGKFDTGDALVWSRMPFEERKNAIEEMVADAIGTRGGASRIGSEKKLWVDWNGTDVLVCVHGIPGAMATAAAREKVGRPFHHDHLDAQKIEEGKGGPVHLIACYKGVTELQAMTLLGRPDVTTVDAPFGILAVDQVSKVQCVFLRNCRDQTGTRQAVTRAFEWLSEAGEERLLAQRALARAEIVRVIATQLPVR